MEGRCAWRNSSIFEQLLSVKSGPELPALSDVEGPALSEVEGKLGAYESARMQVMGIEEIESEALKLDPTARARLAERLLESLELLSDEEMKRLWAEEAERRGAGWDRAPGGGLPAADVLHEARSRLK